MSRLDAPLSLRSAGLEDLSALLDMLRRFYAEDRIPLDEARVRRGLGGALLASACDWVRRHGAEVARLEVNRHNPRAKALYLRAGFRDDDRDILGIALGPVDA